MPVQLRCCLIQFGVLTGPQKTREWRVDLDGRNPAIETLSKKFAPLDEHSLSLSTTTQPSR
jgi:hypothetical protein